MTDTESLNRLFLRRKAQLRGLISEVRDALVVIERELDKEGEPFLTGSRSSFASLLTVAGAVEGLGYLVAESRKS